MSKNPSMSCKKIHSILALDDYEEVASKIIIAINIFVANVKTGDQRRAYFFWDWIRGNEETADQETCVVSF